MFIRVGDSRTVYLGSMASVPDQPGSFYIISRYGFKNGSEQSPQCVFPGEPEANKRDAKVGFVLEVAMTTPIKNFDSVPIFPPFEELLGRSTGRPITVSIKRTESLAPPEISWLREVGGPRVRTIKWWVECKWEELRIDLR